MRLNGRRRLWGSRCSRRLRMQGRTERRGLAHAEFWDERPAQCDKWNLISYKSPMKRLLHLRRSANMQYRWRLAVHGHFMGLSWRPSS